ncbi:nucleotidyltransferase domain-containing protein [Candidatus Poriferisocius sp.]|uniref:nucleotidyltransferase domain-containing protein n=1 Tax=Candidatus Poriferisocius sp. TaxID=3101276 RepID=UPI003B010363
MALVSPPLVAPGMHEARRAGEKLADMGAAKVLVFGSVASGDAVVGSDIDLVAIFDDLGDYSNFAVWCTRDQLMVVAIFDDLGDYSNRNELRVALTVGAQQVTGVAIDLWVTDHPEWTHRSTAVTSSFEAAVAESAVVLVDRPPRCSIDWEKEIGMPADDRGEALQRLRDTHNSLGRSLNGLYESAQERMEAAGEDTRRWAMARYERVAFVCTDSQKAIECAYKTVACLLGLKPERIHSLSALAKNFPEEYLDVAQPALDPRNRVTPSAMTLWHTAGPYSNQRPALDLAQIEETAVELAGIAAATATALAAHFEGVPDASVLVSDIFHTVNQINTGLAAGDVGP